MWNHLFNISENLNVQFWNFKYPGENIILIYKKMVHFLIHNSCLVHIAIENSVDQSVTNASKVRLFYCDHRVRVWKQKSLEYRNETMTGYKDTRLGSFFPKLQRFICLARCWQLCLRARQCDQGLKWNNYKEPWSNLLPGQLFLTTVTSLCWVQIY